MEDTKQTEIEGKIKEVLTDIQKEKANLKELKKSIKNQKKNKDENYLDFKKKIKELNKEAKAMQDEFERDLSTDGEFTALLEMKIKAEETLAHHHGKLEKLVNELPEKKPIQLTIETELGRLLANINPEMKVYVNGKEEKRQ